MNIETLAVILLIAGITTIVGRALGGFNLPGCLITYVLSVLGGVAGWLVQTQLFGADNLVTLPLAGPPVQVSVIGATVGTLLLAFIGSLLGRPVQPRRPRSRPRR